MKLLPKVSLNGVQSKAHAIFCVILAMFLLICLTEIYLTISAGNKLFKHKKVEPELEMWPAIINSTIKSRLIWYNENDVTTVDNRIKLTDDFIEAYRMHPEPPNVAPLCDFKHPPQRGQICPIDLDNFGPCAAPFYGYYSFSPCIFLKLNKILGWLPNYYNSLDTLPASMPKDLIKKIKNTVSTVWQEGRHVWVSCEGDHDVDKDSIETFNYYPSTGFPSYYFPLKYKKEENFSPLIAVEIVNPKPGFIINIKCRAWTKDLYFHNNEEDQQKLTLRFGIMREELDYENDQVAGFVT